MGRLEAFPAHFAPRRIFLVRLFPQRYPPTTAREAAVPRRMTRIMNPLDPRVLAVAVVVSVSVVVTLVRVVCVVVVVVAAMTSEPTA